MPELIPFISGYVRRLFPFPTDTTHLAMWTKALARVPFLFRELHLSCNSIQSILNTLEEKIMTTILSCGHREDDEDRQYNVMTKEWSREYTKAVAYKCVCLYCFDEYERNNEILYTDNDAYEWLTNRSV